MERAKTRRDGATPTARRAPSSLPRHFRKRHPEAGARPGTLCIPEGAPPPRIHVIEYDAEGIEVREIDDVAALELPLRSGRKRWVDIQGLGDEPTLRRLGELFGLHLLLLEDVVNVPQPPKSEVYETCHFFVARMVQSRDGGVLDAEQVSIVVGPDVVLTFQERAGDVLDPVRRRLRDGLGPMRGRGPDYLAYAILDTVVDHYYPAIEVLGRSLETLEEDLVLRDGVRTMRDLLRVKTDLLSFRRSVRPQRDALAELLRDGSPYMTDTVLPYFRDTLDHCTQALEVIDTYRELVTGLMNTYLSIVSNRTNEVMKVLTIMASIFIPLTFLAGIYGMNFEHMPELHARWAYPALLLIMATSAGGMLTYFWRKGWIGPGSKRDDETR